MPSDFNKVRFVRSQLVTNQNISEEDLREAWRACPDAPDKLPVKQDIYSAVSVLRKKYAVKELPYVNGRLNLSQLARAAKADKPSRNVGDIHEMLKVDGFDFSRDGVKKALQLLKPKDKAKTTAEEHPDPNHGKGPRAGKPKTKPPLSEGDRRFKKGRLSIEGVQAVSHLIDALGGVNEARLALHALEAVGNLDDAVKALDLIEAVQFD